MTMAKKSQDEHGANPSLDRELLEAVFMADMNKAKSSLEKGANVNKNDPERNVTPLIMAVTKNDLKMAEFLLKNGADPNKGFKQPITEDDKEMIRELRKMRQDDPEWIAQNDTTKNEDLILSGKLTEIDVSPMGIAMRKRNVEMIALLKKCGAK